MLKPVGNNSYLHALSRGAVSVHREAYGALPSIVRPSPTTADRHAAAFAQISRRFGQLGIHKAHITKQVIDPLAVVVSQSELTWYFRSVVDTRLLIDHPSAMVMSAISLLGKDGVRPVVPASTFIDWAAEAYGMEINPRKTLQGEDPHETLARMHEIAAKCIHGLIRWQ